MFRYLHRDAVSLACKVESRLASSFKTSSKPEFVYSLLVRDEQGAALLEFAIVLPLLVVFVVGIFDFSGAFNQKQKIEQAAQEGAIVAGAQPMSDIATATADPESLHPVVTAVFNSLAGSGVLPSAGSSCTPSPPATPVPTPPTPPGLMWTYTITGCPDSLAVTINRGSVVTGGPPAAICTMVTVTYPYHWRFNSVIQLLFPGSSSYAATTLVTESAIVHNQM
ncbi:MAG: TadE/TadG family type IV pilus assembly protein [Terriglobales bacterium]